MKSLLALTLLVVAAGIFAQQYPNRPVRLVVPLSPGGFADTPARLLTPRLSEQLGKQFFVENRPGAGGTIGWDFVAKQPPDGYTILLGSINQNAIAPFTFAKLPYNASTDFTPVVNVGYSPLVLDVHPTLPVKNVKDLIALAKARPNQLNFGSAGSGSPNHLAIELLKTMAKVSMVHVPYKGGSGQMVGDLLAGQVQLASIGLPPAMPYVKSGKLRVIAVTGAKRSTLLPDAPTVSESGLPGFDVTSWYGMFGPAALPRELVLKINADIAAALAAPDVKDRLAASGADPAPTTPEELGNLVREEVAKWAKVVAASGARVD